MVDNYVWGKVDRISPEAPVPVVRVTGRENRLGGAANVALNVKSLGGEAILCTIVGNDTFGQVFQDLLVAEGLSNAGILVNGRPTTVKTRIIGNNHQLLRVDEEDDAGLSEDMAQQFKEHVRNLIESVAPDVIIFEDYDKGLIDASLIGFVVSLCQDRKIPVAVDPKRRNFLNYKGVTLFKPNLKELKEGLKTDSDLSVPGELVAADAELRARLGHKYSLITLSEAGIFASSALQSYRFPTHVRNVSDVSGAGDTVISTAALCLAAGADISILAMLANLAGGIVCEKVGVVPVDAARLREEALRLLEEEITD